MKKAFPLHEDGMEISEKLCQSHRPFEKYN